MPALTPKANLGVERQPLTGHIAARAKVPCATRRGECQIDVGFNRQITGRASGTPRQSRDITLVSVLVCLALLTGCASTNWVTVREAPRTPLVARLNLLARGGPKPTERTMQFLLR